MLKQQGVSVDLEDCTDIVKHFRYVAHPAVRQAWLTMETMLMQVASNPTQIVYTGDDIRRVLNIPGDPVMGGGWRWPSGTVLRFPKLRSEKSFGKMSNYFYQPATPISNREKSTYPSAFFQAHIQSLANEVITDIRERLIRAGFFVCMECYDELTMVIDREQVNDATKQQIQDIAQAPMSWWPEGPPLEAEVKFGECYYEAK